MRRPSYEHIQNTAVEAKRQLAYLRLATYPVHALFTVKPSSMDVSAGSSRLAEGARTHVQANVSGWRLVLALCQLLTIGVQLRRHVAR
eukprot:scaffold71842_cov33-Tisochrysis_lutea.AAC.1